MHQALSRSHELLKLIPSSHSAHPSPPFNQANSYEGSLMNEVDRIRKLIADNKAGEKGWQKVLNRAEGSFSRKLAEENLRRLEASHQTLVSQLIAATPGN